MKKRTLGVIAFTATFIISSFTSCGGGESHEAKHAAETIIEEVTEVAAEEVIEETAAVDTEAGKEKFAASGCVACHQVDVKTVGPSIKEIATAYADNKEGLAGFLNGEGEAIVDPAQAAVMAPQIELTKAMEDGERNSIIDYILSVQ